MAKQFIEDGEKGFAVRKKINENFSELYYNDSLYLSGSNLSLNYLTKYGNKNTLLNSTVYDNGTNVGIGTNNPGDKLHVVGGNIVGYSGNLATYTGLVVRNRTVSDYTIDGRIIVDTVNNPNKVIIGSSTNHPLQIITNNTQRVWIDSSGISASGNLNVSGDVTITGNLSAFGTTTQIDTKMYVTSAVSITNTGSGPALFVKQTGTNDIATFLDDNNTALIVKDGGKVGIGLDNPSRTLSVNGIPTVNGSNRSILALMDTSPMGSDIGGGLDFGGIYNIAGNYAEWAGIKGIKENAVNGDYAASLVLSTRATSSSTSEKMRITSTGKVGIGTSSPNNNLHVVSTGLFPARFDGSNTNTTAIEIRNSTSSKIWENAVAGTANVAAIASGSYYIYEQSVGPRMVINTSGNVGIGTINPNERLTVAGNLSASGNFNTSGTGTIKTVNANTTSNDVLVLGANNVIEKRTLTLWNAGASGLLNNGLTTNYISKYGTTNDLVNSLIFDNGTNVGIGTTSPSTKLQINNESIGINSTWQGGTDFLKLFATNGNFSEQAIVFQETGTNVGAKIGVKNVGNGAYDIIFANRLNNSTTSTMLERMRITNSGNLGIGTTSPGSLLHVSNSSTGDQQIAQFVNPNLLTNDTGYIVVGGINTSYSGSFLGFKKTGTNTGLLQLAVRGRPTMSLNENGYLGILTETPSAALDVNGNAYFNKGRVGGYNHVTIRGNQTNSNYGVLTFSTFNNTSDVDIASISGLITSHTAGSESGGFIFTTKNSGVYSEKIRINPDGNLGIGNSAPQGRLDVNGGFTIIRPTNDDPAGGHCILFPRAGTDPYTNPSRLEIRLYGTESIIYNHWAGTGAVRNLTVGSGGAYHHYNGTTGNVGIGTTSPSTKLHVSSTNTFGVTIENTTVAPTNVANADNFTLFKNYYGNTQISNWQNIGMRIGSRTTANGGTGQIVFTTGNDIERMRLDASGNVGIGTSSPTVKLDVEGTAAVNYLRVDPQDGTNEGGEIQLKGSGSYPDMQIDNFRGNIRFHTLGASNYFEIIGGSSSSAALRIPTGGATINGNVGIGTSSPSVKLDVSGQVKAATTAAVVLNITGVGSGYADVINGVATIYSENTSGSGGNVLKVGSAFSSNGLIVKDTGNVGIGTSSPTAKLHVDGSVYFQSTSNFVGDATFNNNRGSSNNHITIKNNITNYGAIAFSTYLPTPQTEVNTAGIRGVATDDTNGYGDLVFLTKGSSDNAPLEKVRIYNNSNVGIGTRLVGVVTNSTYNGLTVGTYGTNNGSFIANRYSSASWSEWYDLSNGSSFGTNNAKYLYFKTNNTERMRISSGGNVGVATSNPARIFHTNGTIRFEGLSVYGNNSDAKTAGLLAGDVYKTSTGELRIVF